MESKRARRWGLSIAVALTAAAAPSAARASFEVQPTRGSLLYPTGEPDRPLAELPLAGADVRVHIVGYVARVEVRQTFNNPFKKALEAIYVFPMPDDAAVGDMFIRVGDQRIRSAVERRARAAERYQKARKSGRLAALLEQERPNIFTQSVANIEPGKEVLVHIRYDVPLRYVGGEYEFVYPMVVGPRYIPGRAIGKSGSGRASDTDQVRDASRITPPVRKPGSPAGHNVSLEVTIDPGTRIDRITSPTHKVRIDKARKVGAHAFKVTLPPGQQIPNKDFVVRYRLANASPRPVVAAQVDDEGGYLALTLHPPAQARELVSPREVVFLVDASSRMAGEPMSLVKRALRHGLDQLAPDDRFRLVRFDGAAHALDASALAPTPRNLRRATSWLNAIHAAGPTDVIAGLRAAFDGATDAGRQRVVVLLTNGHVGNERAVFDEIARHTGGGGRLFALGTGSSSNRYLIEGAAAAGRGAADYALLAEQPDAAVDRFFDRVRAPVMTDVTVDWRGVEVSEVVPAALPDLHAGQPLSLVARFARGGKGHVVVRGKVKGKPVSFRTSIDIVPDRRELGGADSESPTHRAAGVVQGVIARLWARARVRELALQHAGAPAVVEREVTRLALRHGLVTRYTSLVAIGEKVVDDDGARRTFVIPVEMPEGISYDAVFETGVADANAPATGGDGSVSGDSAVGPGEVSEPDDGDADDDPASVELRSAEPTLARDVVSQGSAMEAMVGTSGRRWVYGVGLGLGVGRAAGDRGALTTLDLSVGRVVAPYWVVGAEVGVRVPLFDTDDAVWTSGLLELRYARLLGGRLHLVGGVGGALVSSGELGLSYMGALELQLPLSPRVGTGLQLRLDGAAVGDAADPQGYSLGLRLRF